MEGIRINKYLSEAGICSRREADRLIQAGRVLLAGRTAIPGDKVSEWQEVAVDGKVVNREGEEIFLAFYKPKGVVCTTADTEHGEKIQNVVEYVQLNQRILNFLICNPESSICKILGIQAYKIGI